MSDIKKIEEKIKALKEKKEKVEREKYEWDEDSLTGTNFYFNGMGIWSFRSFCVVHHTSLIVSDW